MSFLRLLTLGLPRTPRTGSLLRLVLVLSMGLGLGPQSGLGPRSAAAQSPNNPAGTATTPAKPPAKAPARPAVSAAKTPAKPPAKVPAKTPLTATAPGSHGKASCLGTEGQVSLLPAEADIKCNAEFEECEGKIELVANNCTGEFQSFYKVELFEGGRRQQVLEFDPAGMASPGGGQWKETVSWTTQGQLEAVVYYHPPGQSGEATARAAVKVQNRALTAAKDACTKCEGTWGRWGVNKFEGCNCKMPDAGKTCYDGDECQGYCLFRRYDSEAREEGECSETQRVQGCIGLILKGQSKVVPRRPPPRKQPTCMD